MEYDDDADDFFVYGPGDNRSALGSVLAYVAIGALAGWGMWELFA